MAGLTIPQLRLNPIARHAAEVLLAACPSVIFTSGRRDLHEQAHAMAVNVAQNRSFIRRTYLRGAQLQTWVDTHPEAQTVEALYDGLLMCLSSWSVNDLSHLSRHLTGDAFDVKPMVDEEGLVTAEGTQALVTIHQLPGLDTFLDHEGALIRWHVQFTPSAEV